MSLARVLLVSALLVPGPARAQPKGTATTPPPAVLVLRGLPAGTRVTLDGLPVGDPRKPIALAPGSYLLDVYPPAAPTLETYVDLTPGARRVVTYRAGPAPDPVPHPPPVVGQALVGTGLVAALASATWWLLADASAAAEAQVQGQSGLDATTRAAMVAELDARETGRRDVALAAGVAAGLLLVGGAVVWRVLDTGATVHPMVAPTPGGAVAGLTVRLP